MEWSKEIPKLCIAPMVAASFFERGGGAQRSRPSDKKIQRTAGYNDIG